MKITVAAVRVIIFTFGLVWFFIAAGILLLLHEQAGWGDLALIGTGILLWVLGMGGFYLILRYLKSKG